MIFFFLYLLFVFRKVTSQPFSRIPGNRSFRHIVCSVEVLVKGASQQLPEVRDALGSAPLERLTLKQTIHVPTLQTLTPTPHASTSHTQANTSTPTLGTYKNDADDDSDTTIMYESPQPDSDETVLPYDSDETVLPYDSDETVLPYDSDETVLPSDSDETVLPSDSDETVLPYDSDETVLPFKSDYTEELFSEPDCSTPLRHLTDTPPHTPTHFTTLPPLSTDFIHSYSTPPLQRHDDSNSTPPLPGQKRKHTATKMFRKQLRGRKRIQLHTDNK